MRLMSDRIERFKKRKEIIKKTQSQSLVSGVVDQGNVDKLLNQDIDHEKLKKLDYSTDLSYSLQADPGEVEALLSDLKRSFNDQRLEQLLDETKTGIISSIAGPFGLGKVMSAYDKVGGNVDTIHNVREGVYATQKAKENFENRSEYDSDKYHSHSNYIAQNRHDKTAFENGTLVDEYRNTIMKSNDKKNLDHIVAAKEVHNDAGRVLAGLDGVELANKQVNFQTTVQSINSSKGEDSVDVFLDKVEDRIVNKKEVKKSYEERGPLSQEEHKKLKNAEKYIEDFESIDKEGMRKKDSIARGAINKEIDKEYYTSKEFAQSVASSGGVEGASMGAQQAFGVLMVEFFTASFTEIRISFNEGLEGDSLFSDIKLRLKRVGLKVTAKWKDVIQGFSEGFISGFISNLITTLVNMFMTTAKRLVRMIREGVFSLLKALKLIICPPTDMSYREAMHAAMKLIAAGGMIVAGVALEEIIEKLVLSVPFLVPFATIVTSVIVGSLTAISMALVTYLIDKMDILGVMKIEETKYILKSLDGDISATLKRCESITVEIDEFLHSDDSLLPASS